MPSGLRAPHVSWGRITQEGKIANDCVRSEKGDTQPLDTEPIQRLDGR